MSKIMDAAERASARPSRSHLIAEIERLTAERDEWKQAAQVEARLRREFLSRAEQAEAERDRLLAALDGIHTWAIDLPDAQTRARNAIVNHQQQPPPAKATDLDKR